MNRALRFQLILFVLIRTVINTALRMVYPYQSIFRAGLGVSDSQFSLALALRQGAGIAGPFLASVADSRGRKTGMVFGLLIFSAAIAVFLLFPGFPTFILALVLSLVGNFVFMPSLQAYLGDHTPYAQRGKVIGLTELSWSASFFLGVPAVGWALERLGWKAPFPFFLALGALSVLALLRVLPRDQVQGGKNAGLWKNLAQVLTFPPALAGLLLGICMSSANELVNMTFSSWLQDSFQVTLGLLGTAAIAIGLAELVAELLSTGLTDRLGKPRSVTLGFVINILAFLALPLLGQSLPGALAALFLIYLSFEFTVVSSIPLMTEVLPATRATFMATWIAALSLGRALADLVAFPILDRGILAVAGVGILLNLLALAALRRVRSA